MAGRNVRVIGKVLGKIDNCIKDGNYYEAHQMYRSLYFRYLPLKKYKELSDILYDGAILFLNHGQNITGADLAILLIELLVKSNETDYVGWTPKLCKIFALISSAAPQRDTFLIHAIRWSANQSAVGHPFLHKHIAQVYWDEKNYSQARHHFIYSKDGLSCAKLLIEFQSVQGFKCEADLFIAQTVLQYLCLSNKITAHQTFTTYIEQHPRIKKAEPPYLLPLLNFLFFLLQAIESRKIQTFAALCEQYKPSITRDPCYVEYLDKIGQIFFGLKPPPKQPPGGLFGNFLESFLSGLDDSDDDTPPPQASTSTEQMLQHSDLD